MFWFEYRMKAPFVILEVFVNQFPRNRLKKIFVAFVISS